MSYSSDKVKAWRKRTKQRIVDSLGGSCINCNYKNCTDALELHHLDPTKKEFGLGAIRASPINWNKIVLELRKCILLCSNCHKELHAGLIELPIDLKRFDENFSTYRYVFPRKIKEKKIKLTKWDNIDLKSLISKLNNTEIAKQLKISETAVRKRRKKLNI